MFDFIHSCFRIKFCTANSLVRILFIYFSDAIVAQGVVGYWMNHCKTLNFITFPKAFLRNSIGFGCIKTKTILRQSSTNFRKRNYRLKMTNIICAIDVVRLHATKETNRFGSAWKKQFFFLVMNCKSTFLLEDAQLNHRCMSVQITLLLPFRILGF